MRSDAPALFPVFRSQAQAEILGAVLLHPDRERTVTDLAGQLGLPLTTVADEVRRLVEARVFGSRRVGRSNLLSANLSHPAVKPLTEVVLATVGPHLVVAESFAGMDGVDRVLIYGSWAARYHGEPGPPPNDLDVLVIGRPDRAAVYAAANEVEARTGLPVNPVIASPHRWESGDDPLIEQVKASPVVDVAAATS
jgi:predicted nucleotidyltransferase